MPVACALIPRFPLIVAVADNREVMHRPAALAPEPGAAQLIGEVSTAAEKFGLRAGMRMGEALSRCPELALIPPDPERAESSWEEMLRQLEGIGAEVESDRAGEAFFEAGGPGRPRGGGAGGEPDRAGGASWGGGGRPGLWGGIEGVRERAGADLGRSARLGAGPSR